MVSFAASYDNYRIPADLVRVILNDAADHYARVKLGNGIDEEGERHTPEPMTRENAADHLYSALGGSVVPKSVASEYAGDFASEAADYVNDRVQRQLKSSAFKRQTAKVFRESARRFKKLEPTIENLNAGKDVELAAEEIERDLV